jgi:hypothetical protein
VTPLKSQVKKVTPAAKKKTVLVGTKKLRAVMNVKTGAARLAASTKTGMNFVEQVNGLSEGGDEELKLFEFDSKEAFIAASAAMKKMLILPPPNLLKQLPCLSPLQSLLQLLGPSGMPTSKNLLHRIHWLI